MLEFVGRCFHSNIWGFCSRKGSKYIGFGKEDRGSGKRINEDPSSDPAWDADVDALNEMEYNLVAEQPKGIKLELHDTDALESPREPEADITEKTPTKPNLEQDLTQKALDFANQNELSDLMPDATSENDSP